MNINGTTAAAFLCYERHAAFLPFTLPENMFKRSAYISFVDVVAVIIMIDCEIYRSLQSEQRILPPHP